MKVHLFSLFNVQLIELAVHLIVSKVLLFLYFCGRHFSINATYFFKLQFKTFISDVLPYRQPIFPSGFLII